LKEDHWKLITKNQTAFVSVIQLLDGVVVVNKIIHLANMKVDFEMASCYIINSTLVLYMSNYVLWIVT